MAVWKVKSYLQGQRHYEDLEKGRNPGLMSSCLHTKSQCRLLLVLGFLCFLSSYLLKRIWKTAAADIYDHIIHYGITFSAIAICSIGPRKHK